ncbi:methionyl-tRNA formyltransferase [Chitinivorax tropicus]|uniref:Methionyl-tRNA formyltransferase n=1 Tax=Chitinivorax tropicus TaxID=714531 RepID=A0A840MMC4_9PROT|nr:methionyl-tRNA formyltransferase [Chitinivorax tropicus]MBB5017353.1 methionyl-tRNA formyltransferase [Chitinivorax tropicus]
MKLIFAGTPAFAAASLDALIKAGHDIPLVLTQPDRPAGRGMKLMPSAVKQLALEHGLTVAQPLTLKDVAVQQQLADIQADVMVVAAYGLLLPQAVLDIPRHGCLNVHGSLLPRWRGAAPIHRAIQAGDGETGITIMQMEAGLDTGPMLLKKSLPITDTDTTADLHDKLAAMGAESIVEALALLKDGALPGERQDDALANYAAKLTKAESVMDWKLPAAQVARTIRAFNPFPGVVADWQGEPLKLWMAQAVVGEGEPGRVLKADGEGIVVACGSGAVCLTELQRAGGKRLSAAALLAGLPIKAGERFTCQ